MATIQQTDENNRKFSLDLLRVSGDLKLYERVKASAKSGTQPETPLPNGDFVTCFDLFAFCAKVYKPSHSINSVKSKLQGIDAFAKYLAQRMPPMTLEQAIEQIKTETGAKKYRLFDEFATWLDGVKGYAPNVTGSFTVSAKSLAIYCDCAINDGDFKQYVTLPAKTSLDEEYPSNDVIMRILDACSPRLRTFLYTMIDAGFEPVDAARLHKDMIFFDESPVRIQFKRKKTSKPITAFVNDYTASALKQQIENTGSQDGYVFVQRFNDNSLTPLYDSYGDVLKRLGMTDSIATKADGKKINKYHFKIFKKRWFTMAIMAGVPEYVAQGMLGRKKYLDQYMALPLDEKRVFAKKIMRKVAIYQTKEDQDERRKNLAVMLGIPESQITPELEAKMRAALFRSLGLSENGVLAEGATQ